MKESIEKINDITKGLLNSKMAIVNFYIEQQTQFYEVSKEDEDDFRKILTNEVKSLINSIEKLERSLNNIPFSFKLKTNEITFSTIEDFEIAAHVLSFEGIELGAEFVSELELDIAELSEGESIEKLEAKNEELVFLKGLVEKCLELSAELEVFFDIGEDDDDY
ncbi:MAG: hypothetical protein H9W81_15000 [Enterococcus sp.]|nr:hypothetical protein [Enterococcus sp.]